MASDCSAALIFGDKAAVTVSYGRGQITGSGPYVRREAAAAPAAGRTAIAHCGLIETLRIITVRNNFFTLH